VWSLGGQSERLSTYSQLMYQRSVLCGHWEVSL